MDEEDDKHLCYNCNETIYGLMNYVIHRKNSCAGKSISAEHSSLKKDVDKDSSENKSARKRNASKALAQNSLKDVSQCQDEGTSLHQELKKEASLLQESGTGSLPSQDDRTSLLQGGNNETSLQRLAYHVNGKTSSVNDEQVLNVNDNTSNKHSPLVEPSGEGWDNVPDNIKKALLGIQEKSVEISDSESKEIDRMTLESFDEMETHSEVDVTSHSPDGSDNQVESEYGILSAAVAGNNNQAASVSNKIIKSTKQSWHLKQDGTQIKSKKRSVTGQSERSGRKSSKHTISSGKTVSEASSVQVQGYPKYVEHKIRERMDGTTENSNSFEEGGYVEVKVEEGTEMQMVPDSQEVCNKNKGDESLEVDTDNTVDDYGGDNNNIDDDVDFDGFESDDYMYEPDKNTELNEMRTDDSAEGSGRKGEIDIFNGIHQCTVCDKLFATKHNLIRHLISTVHKKHAVGKEQEYFSLIEKYHKPIVRHSPFRCDVCSFYFNHHKYLIDHLRTKAHMKKVGNVKNLGCSLCHFTAVSNELLIAHVQSPSHVNKVEKQERICAIKFKVDRKTKGSKKPLICNICPVDFTRKTPSRSHFLTKEHIRWKLAFESGKLNAALDATSGLFGIGQEIESDISKKEIKKENLAPAQQSDFGFDQDEYVGKIMKNIESLSELNGETVSGVGSTKVLDRKSGSECVGQNDSTCYNELTVAAFTHSTSPGNQIGQAGQIEKSDQSYSLKKASACKYCPFETQDYDEMRPHYMKEHAELVKICEVCDFVFPHGKGYKLHVNSKDHQANVNKFENNSEGKFECDVCKKKFAEDGYCKFHTAYYHFHLNTEEDVLRENGIGITREKYSDFLSGIDKVSNTYVLKCPECSAEIKKFSILGHLRQHTGEKPFMCRICTEEFYNSSSLRRHLLAHFDCLEKTCEICGEKFKGLTSYNVHMDIHKAKNTSSEKTNICHICGERFFIKRQLRMHMKKHATKDFKCDAPDCLWAFTNSHALKRHMLTHSDENPFICPTCGYLTKSKKYLKSHEKIHSKDGLLQCDHCPYQTIKTTHLRRHMRIHLGTKPFKCPYCSYACNTHDNIRKHILETALHKGLKVYPCRLCTFGTNCTKEFRTHILTEHTDVSPEDLQGGSLAAFTGLFNKEEDIQTVMEGMEILPCKDRKTSRRKIQTKVLVKHESENHTNSD